MENALPPPCAYTKKILKAAYLQKDEFVNKNHQVLNASIDDFSSEIDGIYSLFSSQKVVLWEGKLHTKSRILLSYPPEILSTHIYLLYFKSNNYLNIKVNLDIPVNEILLNGQSGSELGSFLWASNVGVEVLIPPNTQVDFQLIVVSKKQLVEQMAITTLSQMNKHIIFGKSNVPLFFYSKGAIQLDNLLILQPKSTNYSRKRAMMFDIVINYFLLNMDQSNEICSLWDFQNMLTIEQYISELPINIKPNLAQLAKKFNYPQQKMSKLFSKLFGRTIAGYHCAIHMEYATGLFEIERLNICEVSNLLGFKDCRMFSHRFKSYHAVSPKVYKCKS